MKRVTQQSTQRCHTARQASAAITEAHIEQVQGCCGCLAVAEGGGHWVKSLGLCDDVACNGE